MPEQGIASSAQLEWACLPAFPPAPHPTPGPAPNHTAPWPFQAFAHASFCLERMAWHQAKSHSCIKTRSWVLLSLPHFWWCLGKVPSPPRTWISNSVKKQPVRTWWALRGSQAVPRPHSPPYLTVSTWASPLKSSCSGTNCFLCHPLLLLCRPFRAGTGLSSHL